MAELYLVRHGQASFGAADYDQLSATGVAQARQLGSYFAAQQVQFDHLLVGTLKRQQQTADALLQGYGRALPITTTANLNEYDFRALLARALAPAGPLPPPKPGDPKSYYRTLRDALRLWADYRLPDPLPETWLAMAQRVSSVRASLQASPHRCVLAISSGGPIGMMTQQVLNAPAATAIELNMQIFNSAYCRFFFNKSVFYLSSFNNVPHLDREHAANLTLV